MNTIDKEILSHFKGLIGADVIDRNYMGLGQTEVEYHMSRIIDRLLIMTYHGRLKIQIKIAKDFAGLASTLKDDKQMELDLDGAKNEQI